MIGQQSAVLLQEVSHQRGSGLVSQIVQFNSLLVEEEEKITLPSWDLPKGPFSPVVGVGKSILESVNGPSKLLLQHCNRSRQVGRQVALAKVQF